MVAQRGRVVAHAVHGVHLHPSVEKVEIGRALPVVARVEQQHVRLLGAYLRYQPQSFEVIESTKEDTKTTVYGPDYRDPFQDEVKYFYDCIVNGTKPKSDFEDAMADMVLFRDICKKIKE